MSGQCRLKGREVGGSQCREIGGRIGRATTFWMVNPSLLGSPLATAEHLFLETWLRPVGPLARPSPAVNSGEELSHRERVVSSFRFLGFLFLLCFFVCRTSGPRWSLLNLTTRPSVFDRVFLLDLDGKSLFCPSLLLVASVVLIVILINQIFFFFFFLPKIEPSQTKPNRTKSIGFVQI